MSVSSWRRSVSRVGLVVVVVVLMLCLAAAVASAARRPRLTTAPVNPDFLDYYVDWLAGRVQTQTVDGHGLGYIPAPLDLSHLTGQQVFSPYALLAPPPVYDLRTTGKLGPVKDQGACGSCWAFATYGSMESCLLLGETWDFSENNLKNTHGFDWAHNAGGNQSISTAYLARWSGPIAEANDPYNPSSGISPSGLRPRKHVPDVIYLPDRAYALDNYNIKRAVMTYGAVYTTMWWDNQYWNVATNSYYNNGTYSSNHAICIVGWDDNYAAAKFLTPPPGNGAFIIRNSWGAGWGQAGYFYISYYDAQIGRGNAVFHEAESVYATTINNQYDPFGQVGACGYGGSQTIWGGNIFTAGANQVVESIAVYAMEVNTKYDAYVYLDPTTDPVTGATLATSQSGTMPMAGYHTIDLNSPVAVSAGQKFSVVLTLVTQSYAWPLPMECYCPGYNTAITGNSGESFASPDGVGWVDLYNVWQYSNACIKALALPPALGDDTAGLYDPVNGTFYLRDANSNGAAGYTFQFGPKPSTWAPIAGNWDRSDWDDDDADTIGLYSPTTGTFYLRNANSAGAADVSFRFGPTSSTWLPIVGDWDGDGRGTIGLYSPSTGTFYLKNSNSAGAADVSFRFGPTSSTWLPIVGDWEGDGKESVGLYNPAAGTFYLRSQNSAGAADFTFSFGPTSSTWKPLAGDWDDNCVDTVGLYNPTTGNYYLRNDNSAGAADVTFRFGPAPSTWVPLAANWNGW